MRTLDPCCGGGAVASQQPMQARRIKAKGELGEAQSFDGRREKKLNARCRFHPPRPKFTQWLGPCIKIIGEM